MPHACDNRPECAIEATESRIVRFGNLVSSVLIPKHHWHRMWQGRLSTGRAPGIEDKEKNDVTYTSF